MKNKSVLAIVACATFSLSGVLFAQTTPSQLFNEGNTALMTAALSHPKCDPIDCNIKVADLPHPKCDPIDCNIKMAALPHPKCDPIDCNIKVADLPHPKCDPIDCNIKMG